MDERPAGVILLNPFPGHKTVELVYLDAHSEEHETVIQRAKRDGEVVLGAEFPPFYVEFESRRLADMNETSSANGRS